MKSKFLRQDYFQFKRLGKKWRRPKGRQSKLRKEKSGSGLVVKIGYGSAGRNKIKNMQPIIVSNPKQLENLDKEKNIVVISSNVGAKKVSEIADRAKGFIILNKKKIKRAEKIAKTIETKRKKKAEEKKKAKQEAEKKKEDQKESKKEDVKSKPAKKETKEKAKQKKDHYEEPKATTVA